MLSSALEFIKHNYKIFPIYGLEDETKFKMPVYYNSIKNATNSRIRVEAIWGKKNYGIALPAGEINNFIVVDIDTPEALEFYKNNISSVPENGVVSITKRGVHIFYRYDNKFTFKNSVGKLHKNIDIKTNGGYIIAPATSGYSWANKRTLLNTILPDAPQKLINILQDNPTNNILNQNLNNQNYNNTSYGLAILQQDSLILQNTVEGKRNHTLNALAYKLYNIADAGFIDLDLVTTELFKGALICGLPTYEIHATLESAKKSVAKNKRTERAKKENENFLNLGIGQTSPAEEFKFKKASDLPDQTEEPWLIDNFILERTNGYIYGKSGTYKTFVVLGMGLAVASGTPWLKKYKAQHKTVLYICGEGLYSIKKRILAWCINNDINIKEVDFYISNKAIYLNDGASFNTLVDAINKLIAINNLDIGLIIIDTLARNFLGSENDTETMAKFTNNVSDLASLFNCSTLLVHHAGAQEISRARGSTVLKCSADFEFTAVQAGKQQIKLSNTKQKDYLPPDDLFLKLILVNTSIGKSCVLI